MSILKKYKYFLKGLDCAVCAKKIEERLALESAFADVVVNFSTLKLSLSSTLSEGATYKKIKKLIMEVEPEVEVLRSFTNDLENSKSFSRILYRLLLGVIFSFLAFLFPVSSGGRTLFIFLAYAILLSRTIIESLKLLFRSKTINENLLITISCIGAWLIGEYFEGLMVIFLYEIGKMLEEKAVDHSRKSIASLMNIRPNYVNRLDGSRVDPREIAIGDCILVYPFEMIPLDGEVVSGKSTINNASLTGESRLIPVLDGAKVLSGGINGDGLLTIRVSALYQDSMVSRILDLVENATDKRAKTETLVSQISRVYTPIVLVFSVLVFFFLPMVTSLSYTESLYRALVFLVISCPCAIAISVPLSYFSGIGRASQEGILIKGSNYLDALSMVREIIFDKTGTLTTGKFGIVKISSFSSDYKEMDILKLAVIGEKNSTHPIARAILDYSQNKYEKEKVTHYQEIAGKGIVFQYQKKEIRVGSGLLVLKEEVFSSMTNVFVSVDGVVVGQILLNDEVKVETKEAIERLVQREIKTQMFTGDSKDIALAVGHDLGIDKINYEMLPDDKYCELEKVMQNSNSCVAFVGDGMNDAPVLVRADVGISMGGIGSSAAIEASDIVIMTDNLLKLDRAFAISKITRRIIWQNLLFAMFTKVIILFLSVIGIGGMWQAIFADVGVTLITIFNTMRILRS